MLNENELSKKFQKTVVPFFLYDPKNGSKIYALFEIPPIHNEAILRNTHCHEEDGDAKPLSRIIEDELMPDIHTPFGGITDSKFTAKDARAVIEANLAELPPAP